MVPGAEQKFRYIAITLEVFVIVRNGFQHNRSLVMLF